MFRKGDYKIVRLNGGDWELYHMKEDPTELNDLAPVLPDKVMEMTDHYAQLKLH